MNPTSAAALHAFVTESNAIEGITRPPLDYEVEAHATLLSLPSITVADLEAFVKDVAAVPLRRQPGQNVCVGAYRPPPGGPNIEYELETLLADIAAGCTTPYRAHIRYELLHPFMDGNGRSGRALWAWHKQRNGHDPFQLPFLQAHYYASLDAAR